MSAIEGKAAELRKLWERYDELANQVLAGTLPLGEWASLPWGDSKFLNMLLPRLRQQNAEAIQHAHVAAWAKKVGLQVTVVQQMSVPATFQTVPSGSTR